MATVLTHNDTHCFYRVAALGLRALQDRGLAHERFSADSLARWRAFKGELTDSNRLDLLLRDGAATYALAFAAREVFGLEGLAEDEPFGPEWVSLPPSKSGPILREAESPAPPGASAPLAAVLGAVAEMWGVPSAASTDPALEKLAAASRFVLCGAGAVIGLATRMAGRTDTDFGDQVLLVTDAPGVRQLAGLAAALTGSRRKPVCLRSTDAAAQAIAAGFKSATGLAISADASQAEANAARAIAAELGA